MVSVFQLLIKNGRYAKNVEEQQELKVSMKQVASGPQKERLILSFVVLSIVYFLADVLQVLSLPVEVDGQELVAGSHKYRWLSTFLAAEVLVVHVSDNLFLRYELLQIFLNLVLVVKTKQLGDLDEICEVYYVNEVYEFIIVCEFSLHWQK